MKRNLRHHKESIVGKISEFETQLQAYAKGEVFEESFIAACLQLGVIAQTNSPKKRVRVRTPVDALHRARIDTLKELARRFSASGNFRITRRNQVSFDEVPLEKVASLLRTLVVPVSSEKRA